MTKYKDGGKKTTGRINKIIKSSMIRGLHHAKSGEEWPQAKVLGGKALDKFSNRNDISLWYREEGEVLDNAI